MSEHTLTRDMNVFLCGIGGVSMCSLAETLLRRGWKVCGSDRSASDRTKRLEDLGIKVFYGHDSANIAGCDAVVRTAAVGDTNPEITAARAAGIPVLERAEAWGEIMENFSEVVCIAGTHGKSTTTGMISEMTINSGMDPFVMIGADLPSIGGTLRYADDGLFVAEACEYHNSFLHFRPTIAVISNIEADHLDFFSGIEEIIESFRTFVSLVPERGRVIINGDDKACLRAAEAAKAPVMTFGLGTQNNVYAENISFDHGCASFSVIVNGAKYCRVSLKVPGVHNIRNALATIAVGISLDMKPDRIAAGLERFSGIGRRFEYTGEFNGALVYDDYAHHPSEIRATLAAARGMDFERVIVVFQPHTYSRTGALKADFAAALALADIAVLVDIYAAREVNNTGLTSGAIAELLPGALFLPKMEDAAAYVRGLAQKGDLIVTMGAGDVYKVGPMILGK